VQLKQADLALELLKKFDDPRKQSELEADLKEAQRGLDRARLEADARIADFQAALTTSEARWQLEKEKLASTAPDPTDSAHRDRVGDGRLHADGGGRMGGGEAVQRARRSAKARRS